MPKTIMQKSFKRNKTVKFVQLYYDAGGDQNDLITYTKTVADLTQKGYKFVEGGNCCDFYYVGGGELDTNCDVLIFADNPALYRSFIKMTESASIFDSQGMPVLGDDVPEIFNNSKNWPKNLKEQNSFLIKKTKNNKYTDFYEVEFDPNAKAIFSPIFT
jgi:hypothetical protein